MFDENEAVSTIKEFIKINRESFCILCKKTYKIKPSITGKLYKKIENAMETKSINREFEGFLSTLNSNEIQNDYYHILRYHINEGTNETRRNVFTFFQNVVHFEDVE
eukprot:197323_1